VSSPSIVYRQLSPTGDPQWGQGSANFLADLPAVAQAVLTRLRLFQGEWWASLTDGLPLWQTILGQSASPRQQAQIAAVITARILATPFVVSVSAVSTTYNSVSRAFTYSATVNTSFGAVAVTNQPVPLGVSF
jgi:hypothetical protein